MTERVRHLAHKISQTGDVSPWCAKKPRAIDMRPESTETWVMDYTATTCAKCKVAYRESNRPDPAPDSEFNQGVEP